MIHEGDDVVVGRVVQLLYCALLRFLISIHSFLHTRRNEMRFGATKQ